MFSLDFPQKGCMMVRGGLVWLAELGGGAAIGALIIKCVWVKAVVMAFWKF